ncbi:MAG: hypothetical protein D6718_04340 [Acidobacteria bacterium]|nr:MAG: hypothetical protein D6718_04340 [Acidobacteriota bacterium]
MDPGRASRPGRQDHSPGDAQPRGGRAALRPGRRGGARTHPRGGDPGGPAAERLDGAAVPGADRRSPAPRCRAPRPEVAGGRRGGGGGSARRGSRSRPLARRAAPRRRAGPRDLPGGAGPGRGVRAAGDGRRGVRGGVAVRGLLRTAWAFLVRDFQTEFSYRLAFLLQVIGLFVNATIWYFMARFIGGAGDSARLLRQTGGLDYFSYVLVGLMVNRFLEVSLNAYAAQIRLEQTTGTLEAMLVTRARLGHLVLASSSWSYTFAALQSALLLFFGVVVFGVRLNPGSLIGAVAAVIFTVVALSGIGILSAAFVLYFKRGNPVNFVISSLSFLFGNVVIPSASLPPGIAWISKLIPVSYATEAVRGALLRGEGLRQIAPDLAALAGFAAVLVPIGLAGARVAVRRAKREGSLVQY